MSALVLPNACKRCESFGRRVNATGLLGQCGRGSLWQRVALLIKSQLSADKSAPLQLQSSRVSQKLPGSRNRSTARLIPNANWLAGLHLMTTKWELDNFQRVLFTLLFCLFQLLLLLTRESISRPHLDPKMCATSWLLAS